MEKFLNHLQRKIGKYAVHHLTVVIIACFAVGYLISAIRPEALQYMTLDPFFILRGQVWRLLTWVVIPPSSLSILTILLLFFYFSIGSTLERTWGDFRYNVYIIGGWFISVVSAFASYFIIRAVTGTAVSFGSAYSTYYICMSIFLAFALTYPDMQVLLMFIIPIKVKWLGIVYIVFYVYDIITDIRLYVRTGNIGFIVAIVALLASFTNFIIFFLTYRKRGLRRFSPSEIRRRNAFKRAYNAGTAPGNVPKTGTAGEDTPKVYVIRTGQGAGAARHRCTVCGRTELTHPDLEFRFCSKCAGAHEYCSDHIFTHVHITEN